MTDTPIPLPWVLVRKHSPPVKFDSRERAMRFFDQLRFNSGAKAEAALFGPQGEAWYCPPFRSAQWVRDDDRRKRDGVKEAEGAA